MNCPSSHSLFLRSNGSLVCWDDRGQLQEVQAFDPALDYARDVYLGPPYAAIREKLDRAEMPFPKYCSNCCVLKVDHERDALAASRVVETFQIEPSMGCQLECPGCIKRSERSAWVPKRPSGHMTLDPEVLFKIVGDLRTSEVKVRKFDMQGSGEPLLNKHVWKMAAYISKMYPTSVNSLCTHANAEFAPHMVTSGINEILFAIDGVDQGSYAPWRVNGNFYRAHAFMRAFSREADSVAPSINRIWKYVLFEHNDTREHLLEALAIARDAKVSTLRFVVTQLGPASQNIFGQDQLPEEFRDAGGGGPRVIFDSYMISIPQIEMALVQLMRAIETGDEAQTFSWAQFTAHSLHRLFNSHRALALRNEHLVDRYVALTQGLRADRYGRLDWILRQIPAFSSHAPPHDKSCAETYPFLEGEKQVIESTGQFLPKPSSRTSLQEARKSVGSIPVEEEFYLSVYPDVRSAVLDGIVASGTEHYRAFGYCEGRLPAAPRIDADWYEQRYADVREAIRDGRCRSPVEHFIGHGYREGRSSIP